MAFGDSEEAFEDDVLGWASELGWQTHRAADFEKQHPRAGNEPFYESLVTDALVELNDCVTADDAESILDQFEALFRTQEELVAANRSFYSALSRGIDVTVPSEDRTRTVSLVDGENPGRNRFDAVRQFRFEQGYASVRPDVVLLVNGIPFVVSELKASNRGKTPTAAISDLHEYEKKTPKLFYSVLFNLAATRQELRYGAPGAGETHYNPWKPEDTRPDALPGATGYDVETAFKSLCSPGRLLELAERFVFYNERGPRTSKVLPRHPQYFGTNAVTGRYEKAISNASTPVESPVSGLVWHTQGSGKSYTMFYAARHVVREYDEMAIILVDRKNLKEQFSSELRQLEPGFDFVMPESIAELRELLQTSPNKILLTNIQLFQGIERRLCDGVPFLFSDEAHRFMEKDLGDNIDAALGAYHHYGFTGTPVQEGMKRDTFSHFAMDGVDTDERPFLHRYSMQQAVQEEVIVRVDVVKRADAVEWEIDKEQIDNSLISEYSIQKEEDLKQLVSQELSAREVAEIPSRTAVVAEDVASYFEKRVRDSSGANKAMVVTSSREAASLMGEELQEHLDEEEVRVLYTARQRDSDQIAQFHTDRAERERIQTLFKSEDDPRVLVVCNMLLTGFDAPNLGTIFLDRQLRGHTLMQAIARANRPLEGKSFGEIVDYWGVYDDIENMHQSMSDEIELYVSEDKAAFIDQLERKLASLQAMCESAPANISDTEEDAESIVGDGRAERFKNEFKNLRDLRESIQPDKRLIRYNEPFERLANVYGQIQSIEDPGRSIPREQFLDDAKAAIENGTTVTREDEPPSEVFEVEEWMSEDLSVHRIYHTVEDALSKRRQQSPAFAELSERVEEIISSWSQDSISSAEALDEFEEVEAAFNNRPQPDDMNQRQWFESVVVDVLVEETPADIPIDEEIVSTIVDTFTDNWEETRRMSPDARRRRLTTEIRKSLLFYGTAGDSPAKRLAKTDFSHKVCGYLIRNSTAEN
jgi:type I restriction enzyme R subunit